MGDVLLLQYNQIREDVISPDKNNGMVARKGAL